MKVNRREIVDITKNLIDATAIYYCDAWIENETFHFVGDIRGNFEKGKRYKICYLGCVPVVNDGYAEDIGLTLPAVSKKGLTGYFLIASGYLYLDFQEYAGNILNDKAVCANIQFRIKEKL